MLKKNPNSFVLIEVCSKTQKKPFEKGTLWNYFFYPNNNLDSNFLLFFVIHIKKMAGKCHFCEELGKEGKNRDL